MNENIHIENVLILVNVILVLYLVYCYSNRAIERFHEDGTYPRNQPHNHYTDGDGNTDDNTGCGDDCLKEGEPIKIYVYNGVTYNKCYNYPEGECPMKINGNPDFFIPCTIPYYGSDRLTCNSGKTLNTWKNIPFMDNNALQSDPQARKTDESPLLDHDENTNRDITGKDYLKYFYVNKSKLFETRDDYSWNFYLPKDYEINSSGDFSLMQGYRTILYSKEDFGNLSIANNSQTIISPVIKYLDKDGILHDTQTPAVVQSTEAVVQS